MSETVYISGHKNPDSDSICSAFAYAELKKNALGPADNYRAVWPGPMNSQTRYIFDQLGVAPPPQ